MSEGFFDQADFIQLDLSNEEDRMELGRSEKNPNRHWDAGGRPRTLSVLDCILASLMRLRSVNFIHQMAFHLQCSIGTADVVYRHFCWASYLAVTKTCVVFPSETDQVAQWMRIPEVMRNFFPGLVIAGVVDGFLSPIPDPCREYPPFLGLYFSGKMGLRDYFYNHQIVFDLFGKIIFASFGGRSIFPDITQFRDSEIYQHTDRFLPPNHKLLGDKGYFGAPEILLTPFKRPLIDQYQVDYNATFSYLRAICENGIGALEFMFPILRSRGLRVHWRAPPRIALVCAGLYNFIKDHNDGHIGEYRFDYLLDPESCLDNNCEDLSVENQAGE